MLGQSEQVRAQFHEAHFSLNRHAVPKDMQIRLLEIDNSFTMRISDVGVADIPLLRHNPIEDLRSGWHFMNAQWNMAVDGFERLAQAVPSNATAQRVEVGDELIYLLSYIPGVESELEIVDGGGHPSIDRPMPSYRAMLALSSIRRPSMNTGWGSHPDKSSGILLNSAQRVTRIMA